MTEVAFDPPPCGLAGEACACAEAAKVATATWPVFLEVGPDKYAEVQLTVTDNASAPLQRIIERLKTLLPRWGG